MEFQKKKGAIFGLGLVVATLGGLGTALLVGWFFTGGKLPVLLFLAPFALLAGLGVLVYALLPFRMRIDADGVTTRHPPEGLNTFVPWSQITAVTIERKPDDGADKAPYVVLWPTPNAQLGAEPSFHKEGWPAYLLGQLDEIKETEQQVRDALAHFAGPRATNVPTRGPTPPPAQQPPRYGPPQPPQRYGTPPTTPHPGGQQGHPGYPNHQGHPRYQGQGNPAHPGFRGHPGYPGR